MQKDNFELLATYNRWMNEKIFDASARLSAQELEQDRGAFFGSILGTLNHLMVGDIVWLKRFANGPWQFASLDTIRALAPPTALDAQLYEDLTSMRVARAEIDASIIEFCEEVSAQQLEEELDYTNFLGNAATSDKLGLLLQHLFNHQTHHRGQVTTLLSQAGIDLGPTDLLVCLRNL